MEHYSFIVTVESQSSGGHYVKAEFDGHIKTNGVSHETPKFTPAELDAAWTWLRSDRVDLPEAQAFGARLFSYLFPTPIDGFFREALKKAKACDARLRLVVSLPQSQPLADAPLELLHDSADGLGYLIRSEQVELVRLRPDASSNAPTPLNSERALEASAAPSNHPAPLKPAKAERKAMDHIGSEITAKRKPEWFCKLVEVGRRFGKLFAACIAVLGAIALLLDIQALEQKIRSNVPLIKCVWPYPMEGTAGSFNILMTPFTSLDSTGRVMRDGRGGALAQETHALVANALADGWKKQGVGAKLNVRGPDTACALPGKNAAARAEAASRLANQINAHVVIYGVISDTVSGPMFFPEFYVNYTGFEQVNELTGSHELGRPISVTLPVTSEDFQGGRHAIQNRARALAFLTLGLAEYARDNFAMAITHFQAAANELMDGEGRDVAYLMLGNAYLRQASNEDDLRSLNKAETAYEQARESAKAVGAVNARVELALANALYVHGIWGLRNPVASSGSADTSSPVDLTQINKATRLYDAVEAMPAPPGALIPQKLAFYRAQIAFLQYLMDPSAKSWLDRAKDLAQTVIDAYQPKQGDVVPALRAWAAESYALQGLIAAERGRFEEVQKQFESAISLDSPARKVAHYMDLADALTMLGKQDAACEALRSAGQVVAERIRTEAMQARLKASVESNKCPADVLNAVPTR